MATEVPNPYDLTEVAESMEQQQRQRDAKQIERNAAIERRIAKITNFGGHLNPYDLGQIAEVFGTPNDNGWDH